jgi:hypothetical protein
MSDKVQLKVTLEVTAKSEDVLTQFCADHLRSIGYNVAQSHAKWESLKEFMARLGLERHASIHRDIKLWRERGNTVQTFQAPTGKLMELLSNTDFDAFCKRHKSPEK